MSADSNLGGMFESAAAVEAPITDSSATVDSTVDTTTNDSEMQVIDSTSESTEESTEGETETRKADGTDRTPEERRAFKDAAAQKSVAGKEVTTLEQREALKALRDLDPKYARVVKEMHGAVERFAAIKPLLGQGGVNELKTYLSEVGAKDVSEARTMHADNATFKENVAGTDALLYAADPQLSKNVWEDMRSQGKEANYGKVVGNFLSHLKEVDSAAFYGLSKSNLVASLSEANFPGVVNALYSALTSGDTAKATALTKNLAKFFTDTRDEISQTSKINDERAKWNAERADGETKVQAAERSRYENGVAETCEHSNNTILGKSLSPFLRMAFFKDFPRETKIDLGNGIKTKLYSALKADSVYQKAMQSYWALKPTQENQKKMVDYHNAKLESISDEIVRTTIQQRYPGYAKGGSAAGKVAAAAVKRATDNKASTQSISNMKPVYVASRPANLQRDDVKIGGKQYSASDLITLQIAGKGFIKTADQKSWRYITWRKS